MAARWIEPAALPAAGAIGLCLVGVVLILAAPPPEALSGETSALATPAIDGARPRSQPLPAIDGEPATRASVLGTTGPHPTI